MSGVPLNILFLTVSVTLRIDFMFEIQIYIISSLFRIIGHAETQNWPNWSQTIKIFVDVSFHNLTVNIFASIRDDIHMTSMKIVHLPPPLSGYVQNSSTPLDLDVQSQTNTPPPPNPPSSPNNNQSIKRKHYLSMTIIYYQVFPSGRLLTTH